MPKRFTLASVAVLAVAAMAAPAHSAPPTPFQIHIEQPACAGLPVWVQADFAAEDDPYDAFAFELNRLEVKRDGAVQGTRREYQFECCNGPIGIAPPIEARANPQNRLPLHVLYDLGQPGRYAVRWIRRGDAEGRPGTRAAIVGMSDWLDFTLPLCPSADREAWLTKTLGAIPETPTGFRQRFLPDVLAVAPDARVLRVLTEQLQSKDDGTSYMARSAMTYFGEGDLRSELLGALHRNGPDDEMAHLFSWHRAKFTKDHREIVEAVIPYLRADDDKKAAAALVALGFVVNLPGEEGGRDAATAALADPAVLAAAPALIERGDESLAPLARYLATIPGAASSRLLWSIVERGGMNREQALIALTWRKDEADLVPLGKYLLKPGGPDAWGRDRSSLPYALSTGYGDRALPWLLRGLSESPYTFVRTACAEQLLAVGQPEPALRFILEAVEQRRPYKDEVVQMLREHAGAGASASLVDDAGTVRYIKGRLQNGR